MRLFSYGVLILLLAKLSIGKSQSDSVTLVINSEWNDTTKFNRIEGIIARNEDSLELKIKWCKQLQDFCLGRNRRDLLAKVYFITGSLYYDFSQYSKAVTFLYKGLPIAEEMKLEFLQSKIYNYLGIIYSDQGNSKKAIYYFKKTYAIAVKLNNINQQFTSANNLAVDYNNLRLPHLGLYYITKSEAIAKKFNALKYLPSVYGNKMESYMYLNNPGKAKEQLDSINVYYKKTEQTDEQQVSVNYFSGQYYQFVKEYKTAIGFFEKNLSLIPKNDIQEFRKMYDGLYHCYFELGAYKKAYESLIHFHVYSDSLSNTDRIQKSSETENDYKNYKVEKELEIQKLSNLNKSLQLKRNRTVLILISSLSILLIAGIFFFYKLFRDKRKANALLEIQKDEITVQKKEILDSIYYSKRIQEGILPAEYELTQTVGEHFVLFKPKDIVSGDFYWASKKANHSFLIACCDCTGHGVPGAFMSLVAYSLLNKIDETNHYKNPADILNYLNVEFPKFFKKEDANQQIKDGMDMSLIYVDRKNLKLNFSGANNNIYLIRDNVLQIIKADKQPISADTNAINSPFKNMEIDLQSNDVIFMYTDGFADQFGGPKGKKFKYKQLEEALLKYHTLNFNIIKQRLNDDFIAWKNNLEQLDDICIIGIKI
jgi:serine phosphatase RsbU (regulator of sigma subunit)